jgi:hypothetical protein
MTRTLAPLALGLSLVALTFSASAQAQGDVRYRTCSNNGVVIVRANEFTSCGLARNVQRRLRLTGRNRRRLNQRMNRYGRRGPFRVNRVRSPTTGRRYNLRCQVGARDLLCENLRRRIWVGFRVR